MNPNEWYPNLSHIDHEVQRAVRIAFDSIYDLRRRLNGTQAASPIQATPPAVTKQTVQNIMSPNWGMPTTGLTLSQINAALTAKGSNPLNVQSLLGVLAQPQIGGAPTVTSLPTPPSPTAQDGALVSLSGVLYRFNGSTSPGFWEALLAGAIIFDGTRGAKPGSGAAGTLYFETDTQWLYEGTGASWRFVAGLDYGTDATRAGIAVAAADNGAMFLTSDTNLLWRVIAGAWTNTPLGGTAVTFVDYEIAAGAIDGLNVTYTLANVPNPSTSVYGVLNGVVGYNNAGGDFSVAGAVVTYAVAPPGGSRLWFSYRF